MQLPLVYTRGALPAAVQPHVAFDDVAVQMTT